MPAIMITGYPGFIAGRLLERLVHDRPDDTRFFVLCEARFAFESQRRLRALGVEDRTQVVPCDIRKPGLGMATVARDTIRAEVDEVWHLAAIYDLAVSEGLARSVNVDGTAHVLDLCESLPRLTRLNYVSTCYVAGDRVGWVYEDELDVGQSFHNHYESTKFLAEREVRRRRVPTTIYRPGIVVGDSVTGETSKGDGPYFIVQLLLRLPRQLPMFNLGAMNTPVNLIPVDYVVDAMARLSTKPDAIGRTFHLADPSALTASEILTALCELTGRAPVVGTLPRRLADALLGNERLRSAARIPEELFTYFNHAARFDTSGTADLLAGERPPPPSMRDVLPVLTAWAKNHPHIFKEVA